MWVSYLYFLGSASILSSENSVIRPPAVAVPAVRTLSETQFRLSMFHVLHTLVEKLQYMIIIKRVVNRFAFFPVFDQLHAPHEPELVRYGRLSHVHGLCDITYAHLTA